MNNPAVRTLLLAFALITSGPLRAAKTAEPWFSYDQADETLPVTLLENSLAYDSAVAPSPQGLWVAWLELQPGKGDQLWIGLRNKDGWISKKKRSPAPGDYANPTPTLDAQGKLWLTYESTNRGNWDVFVEQQKADGEFSDPHRLKLGTGANIDHRVAVDPKGGIWIVWQCDRDGQFDILARHVTTEKMSEPILISDSVQNDWAPSATVTPDGILHVAWDSYDGRSYNILERSLAGNKLSDVRILANTPAFEAHAQIASDKSGKLWVAWEEDGENWGKTYRARVAGDKKSTHMADNLGPLHRFRKLHFAELDEKNLKLRELALPMPSLQLAQTREHAPVGLKQFGASYERAQLTVDGQDRPWLLYRHIYSPLFGIASETHKQQDPHLYARCLLPGGWSKLYSFSEGQGDGLQRLFATPTKDGIAAAYTTGRTDRRKNDKPHGVELGEVKLTDTAIKMAAKAETHSLYRGEDKRLQPAKHLRPKTEVAGQPYELFYGDLHRHTDISLCFSSGDGTIDDAYRYAIDAAPLDFLGITDHTHDIASGDKLSLIWWRSRKQVNRHQLAGAFIPFFSFERSRGDTDHNVISLRDDILSSHTYPLPDYWKELDTNTITIPHQPFNPVLWNHKDNVHRPLLEIFQGFRNDVKEADAQQGLKGGHEVGFIASSDHLSTGASYACVWAGKPERETLFRAMQARRTFGATAKIVLKVTCGDHWMGEKFSVKAMPPIDIEITPTASLTSIELVRDGQLQSGINDLISNPNSKTTTSFNLPNETSGSHIFYVRLKQTDGNMAWSSPMFVNIQP
jgi:hypothetical protein